MLQIAIVSAVCVAALGSAVWVGVQWQRYLTEPEPIRNVGAPSAVPLPVASRQQPVSPAPGQLSREMPRNYDTQRYYPRFTPEGWVLVPKPTQRSRRRPSRQPLQPNWQHPQPISPRFASAYPNPSVPPAPMLAPGPSSGVLPQLAGRPAVPVSPPRPAMGMMPQPAPDLGPAENPRVVEMVRRSTVLVISEEGDGVSSGTGFVVGPGLIATCAHVVEDARAVMVVLADGRRMRVTPGRFDAANDVAYVRCAGPLPPALLLGDARMVPVGAQIAVTGYPLFDAFLQQGYVPTASTTFGRVNAARGYAAGRQMVPQFQIDARLNAGNSGGPVYSLRDGAVIGLAQSVLADNPEIGFASTINALRRLLGQ